jgi:hypothetical protein
MDKHIVYRVIIAVRYADAWFDFDSIEEAGEFAKQVLTHLTPNEDTKKRTSVSIEVIDLDATNNDDEEDE